MRIAPAHRMLSPLTKAESNPKKTANLQNNPASWAIGKPGKALRKKNFQFLVTPPSFHP
jgi:hypothetical protein